ncbi:helix-turn-helix transcriptional regulator [Nocardia pseudobrasiliensis]|uniref:helix-turn-helix transcriptional regulator n=1 Tax=Nocardia pseudobrasiliensis TaxID=45979 RepID=UPI001C3F9884|nr:LuxR C-terminal-related transcriptional regulator [Nocardia pseudobrasiliensis]
MLIRIQQPALRSWVKSVLRTSSTPLMLLEGNGYRAADVLVSCTRTLRASTEAAPRIIAVLSDEGSDAVMEGAMAVAHGIFDSRGDTAGNLSIAVGEVLKGNGWISPTVVPRVLGRRDQPQLANLLPGESLTLREKEILAKVVLGLTNAEIAARERITESGVKFHVGNLLRKFGCRHRAELVSAAHGSRSESA